MSASGDSDFDRLLAEVAASPNIPTVGTGSRVGRFTLVRKLGAGSFGAVFEARDDRDGAAVALKLLRAERAEWLMRFKREFRLLADVAHENLVRLDELGSDGDAWFFTMELVKGEPFLDHLRRRPDRIREAFAQLVRGVDAIHRAGRLHRDVKPSNVLVDERGRVVLLDFGLAVDLATKDSTQIAGTPHYMAPEQFGYDLLGTACDLYAIGVMLYEALTSADPFESSSPAQLLALKRAGRPRDPRELAPNAPQDLATLALRLLDPSPGARPTAAEVLETLARQAVGPPAPEAPANEHFVGRERQLGEIARALEDVDKGQPVIFLLAGASGMGKTSILGKFAEHVQRDEPQALVLRGQCYAQEAVPYKAMDGLVDQLARVLARLPRSEVDAVLPRHGDALARLFPVLGHVATIRESRARATPEDGSEERRRAWGALRELLARLADRRTVVLVVDDLQWGDADSAALLGELFRPPDPPCVLFIGAYRADEATTSPLLRELAGLRRGVLAGTDVREITVEPLPVEDTTELVRRLLASVGTDESLAGRIGAESGGCPFLVHELARRAPATVDVDPRVERVVLDRVAALSVGSRRLLEIVAVAGRPVPLDVLQRALPDVDIRRDLAALRHERFVRMRELSDGPGVEAYHDRIRESVCSDLGRERAAVVHRAIAAALTGAEGTDPEVLALHLAESGEHERAADLLRGAAERASNALAFDHAARLYRRVLELRERSRRMTDSERRSLYRALADSLAGAGKGGEAADAYLAAARDVDEGSAFELRTLAGEQLFLAGHMQRGREVLGALFAREGLKLPRGSVTAAVQALPKRAQLSLRGFEFVERTEQQLAPRERRTLDLLSAAATGIFTEAPQPARYLLCELTRRALDSGVLRRILDALALLVGAEGLAGGDWQTPLRALERLAAREGTPYGRFVSLLAQGMVASFEGRWLRAVSLLGEAHSLREAHAFRNATWSRAQFMRFDAFYWTGRVGDTARELPAVLQDLRDRGNLFGQVWMSFIWSWVSCAHDRPSDADEILAQADRLWGKGGLLPRVWQSNNELNVALYRSDASAVERIWSERILRGYHMAFLGRNARVQYYWNEARTLLARAAAARSPAELCAQADVAIDRMQAQRIPWGSAVALALRACVELRRGNRAGALRTLARAAPLVRAVDMEMIGAALDALRGALIGGDEGAALSASAQRWAHDNGVVSLPRFANIYLPGALT